MTFFLTVSPKKKKTLVKMTSQIICLYCLTLPKKYKLSINKYSEVSIAYFKKFANKAKSFRITCTYLLNKDFSSKYLHYLPK